MNNTKNNNIMMLKISLKV